MLFAGLERYQLLVRADAQSAHGSSIRVTYLGVNGYQLEAGHQALLIDPYVTRANLSSVALQRPPQSNAGLVADGLKHVRPSVGAVLVTHGHFDFRPTKTRCPIHNESVHDSKMRHLLAERAG